MKQVIILGYGPSMELCPYDCEVWGINDVYKYEGVKRVDKLFSFNPPHEIPWLDELRKKKYTVVSWQDYATERYPLEEIIDFFRVDYFSCSLSYMVALAIYRGYEVIRFYGAGMGAARYLAQKGGVEFWLGVAIGRGIEIYSSPETHLLKTVTGNRYGYE